jgi:hypothetical protein
LIANTPAEFGLGVYVLGDDTGSASSRESVDIFKILNGQKPAHPAVKVSITDTTRSLGAVVTVECNAENNYEQVDGDKEYICSNPVHFIPQTLQSQSNDETAGAGGQNGTSGGSRRMLQEAGNQNKSSIEMFQELSANISNGVWYAKERGRNPRPLYCRYKFPAATTDYDMTVSHAIRYSKTTHPLEADEDDLKMVDRVVSDSSKYEPDPFLRAFDDHMCYE